MNYKMTAIVLKVVPWLMFVICMNSFASENIRRDTQFYLSKLGDQRQLNAPTEDSIVNEVRGKGMNPALKEALIHCLSQKQDSIALRNAIQVASQSDDLTTHLLFRLKEKQDLNSGWITLKEQLIASLQCQNNPAKIQYFKSQLSQEMEDPRHGMLYRRLLYEGIAYGDSRSLEYFLDEFKSPTVPKKMSRAQIGKNKLLIISMFGLYPCKRSADFLINYSVQTTASDEVLACLSSMEKLAQHDLLKLTKQHEGSIEYYPIAMQDVRLSAPLSPKDIELKRVDCELLETMILIKAKSVNNEIRRRVVESAGFMGTKQSYDSLKMILADEQNPELRKMIEDKLKIYLRFMEN